MRFWDSSGVLPLLVDELTSEELERLFLADPRIIVWWGTELECRSALARRDRLRESTVAQLEEGLQRLATLRATWQEVSPSLALRTSAMRLVAAYDLRAADALQLAAALAAAAGEPGSLPFVCLDRRLRAAAELEGFATLALP